MRKTILEKIFKAPALILEEGVKLEQETKTGQRSGRILENTRSRAHHRGGR